MTTADCMALALPTTESMALTVRPTWLMGPLSFHLPANRSQQISDAIGVQALEDQFLLLVLPAIGQAHVLKLLHPGEANVGGGMC